MAAQYVVVEHPQLKGGVVAKRSHGVTFLSRKVDWAAGYSHRLRWQRSGWRPAV